MKQIKFLLALVGIASIAACCTAKAQTNLAEVPNLLDTNPPTISGALAEIYSAIESSGLTTATNYAIEPYLTYAPKAPSGNQVGGGVFLCYNVSSYIGTGLGIDYLGQFSLVSANVELKVPTHPFRSLTLFGGALTNVAVCPFAIGGLGVGLTGAGGSSGAIAVTDAGAYIGFGHFLGGQFNAGAAYGRWDNAGIYSGPRYHFFAGWSKGF